jgi:hypothetical protein
LSDGEPRRIELSEGRCSFNQGDLGPPHPRELKLRLRDSAGAIEQDWMLSIAGDFADELVQLFCICRG